MLNGHKKDVKTKELPGNVRMSIEIRDFPGSEDLLSKINLHGIPPSMDHLEMLFRTFEASWPGLKRQARENYKRLTKIGGNTLNSGS
ncbi:MAG: hypothetical protein CMJ19_02775 [Phycisphaeraceae bacterium]|nr:hypothetical protein [Phycisphaeraceae bacterium]